MKNKTYILLKDFPGCNAGSVFTFDGRSHYTCTFYRSKNLFTILPAEIVEDNPSWFVDEANHHDLYVTTPTYTVEINRRDKSISMDVIHAKTEVIEWLNKTIKQNVPVEREKPFPKYTPLHTESAEEHRAWDVDQKNKWDAIDQEYKHYMENQGPGALPQWEWLIQRYQAPKHITE